MYKNIFITGIEGPCSDLYFEGNLFVFPVFLPLLLVHFTHLCGNGVNLSPPLTSYLF